jgi:alkyl hydroperoxide reductase subunit F
MYDLVILGGGPAGLTATIYALRKRLNALLITRDLGGKTNYRLQLPFVNQYLVISGEEIVKRFISEINYLEFARVFDVAEKIKKIKHGYEVATRDGNKYQTKALIVATGALGKLLEVPGEKEYMMRGLCYSAVSYAPLFIERNAVVIGDTHLALRSTAELSRIAKKVSLVAPTHGDLDSPMGRKVLSAPNVEILEGFHVNAVKGDDYARRLLIQKNDEERELEADAFFVEIELEPQSQIVTDLVDLDEMDHIIVDSSNKTSAEGIFAAGDVTNVIAEQALIAIGEGAKAALSAYEYLLQTSDG